MTTVDVPAAYDLIAKKFFAERSAALREGKYLDLMLVGLSPGAKVLDFGCGTGRPIAEHLIARGYAVTGVDGSASMLALAKDTIPQARLIRSWLETFQSAESFSAIVAWDSLFHVDRAHHATIYARFAGWLKSGGRLLLTSGGSGDSGFTDQMHGETFFYSSWAPDEAVALLETAGFVIEHREIDQPAGRGHLVLVARKT